MVRGKEDNPKAAPAAKTRPVRAKSVPPSGSKRKTAVLTSSIVKTKAANSEASGQQQAKPPGIRGGGGVRASRRSHFESRGHPANASVYEVPGCNYVAMDRIWRRNVERELYSAKLWEQKWGFLTTPWQEYVQDEMQRLGLTSEEARGRHHSEPIYRRSTPEVAVEPSPPVPRTSSAMIGWRSADPKLDLEKFETRNARPISRLEDKLRVHWSQNMKN